MPFSAPAWQDANVGYKDASIGISVTTKMLHIDSHKAASERLREGGGGGNPEKPQ